MQAVNGLIGRSAGLVLLYVVVPQSELAGILDPTIRDDTLRTANHNKWTRVQINGGEPRKQQGVIGVRAQLQQETARRNVNNAANNDAAAFHRRFRLVRTPNTPVRAAQVFSQSSAPFD